MKAAKQPDDAMAYFDQLVEFAAHVIERTRPRQYALVKFDDGCSLVTTFQSLIDILPDYEGRYQVEHITMSQTEYDDLPEFEG